MIAPCKTPPVWTPLRRAVATLAAVEAILLVTYLVLMGSLALSSDPIGRSTGRGMVMLTLLPLVLCTLPALILAVTGRWLVLALVLVFITPALAIYLFVTA